MKTTGTPKQNCRHKPITIRDLKFKQRCCSRLKSAEMLWCVAGVLLGCQFSHNDKTTQCNMPKAWVFAGESPDKSNPRFLSHQRRKLEWNKEGTPEIVAFLPRSCNPRCSNIPNILTPGMNKVFQKPISVARVKICTYIRPCVCPTCVCEI